MPVLDTPVTTNDASFDRVLSPGLPVVLVFTDGLLPASIEAALTKEASRRAGQVLVVKAPVVDAPQAAQRFGVARAPVLLTLRNGQVHSRSTRLSPSQIEQHAAYLVGEGPQPESVPPQPATSSGSVPKTSASSGPSGADGIPRAVTDQTFDREVMQSALPVVVDFWAPWCGPCRMVAPALDRMAQEMRGRLTIAKVNVDENPGISMRYGIQSIPTMMVVRDGKIVDQWAGAYPEALMRSRILKHL